MEKELSRCDFLCNVRFSRRYLDNAAHLTHIKRKPENRVAQDFFYSFVSIFFKGSFSHFFKFLLLGFNLFIFNFMDLKFFFFSTFLYLLLFPKSQQ